MNGLQDGQQWQSKFELLSRTRVWTTDVFYFFFVGQEHTSEREQKRLISRKQIASN